MNLQYISNSKGKKTGVFIPIDDWEKIKDHLVNLEGFDYNEPTKAEILEGIKDALKEVKLHQQGKIKLKSARELLHEI